MQKNIPLILALNIISTIRIPENNDWVIFILLGCGFLYLFMIISLQRDATIREFLLQSFEDSSNQILSWMIVSLVYCISLSVLVSQYIPFVPKIVAEKEIVGYQLNKIGFTMLSVFLFYFGRMILSYLFYQSIADSRKWPLFYFAATKFYFVVSLILMALIIVHYYFGINKAEVFPYYILGLCCIFAFKNLFYLFHPQKVFPSEWYYKILYICTLQFVPLLALWKLLFF